MSKRGNNEGSVFKRKRDDLWVAQVTIQGRHVSKYFKSQKEARTWLQETLSQIQNGMTLTAARVNVKVFLEEWLDSYKSSVRPKTIRQYAQIVHQHILPYFGEIKLKDLRPDQIQALYNAKLATGVSPRTIILIHAVLHRSLKKAMKWGLIGRNPADAVDRPRFRKKEMLILTDNQARAFLSASKGTRFEALFWIALSTGMRQGEILGLKWTDLNWKTRKLHIQRQIQRIQGEGLVFTEPKSASGRRTIVISETTLRVLQEHFKLQQQEKVFAGNNWVEVGLMFPSTIGTPLDHRNLYRVFKEKLNRAGLPNIRFHDLRHTAATLMLQQGIHPKIVQERLGHADISITLNIYSHVLPSMQEEAAEKVDEVLKPIDVSNEFNKINEEKRSYISNSKGDNNGYGLNNLSRGETPITWMSIPDHLCVCPDNSSRSLRHSAKRTLDTGCIMESSGEPVSKYRVKVSVPGRPEYILPICQERQPVWDTAHSFKASSFEGGSR